MIESEGSALANPIINGPYDSPAQHFEIGAHGPTGRTLDGRRLSESWLPVPSARKGQQQALDFEIVREARERNDLVNRLRQDVDTWRRSGYNRATAISKKLLTYWADPHRENRVLFCQREAAETAIYLAEVAGRDRSAAWQRDLNAANADFNAALPRIALKMATGSGKTVVMAMLIAWQTANKVQSPRDARFAKRFLVVAPGITIRDRLRVLQPSDPGNYYDERDLVPPDLRSTINQAQLVIVNEHVFDLKTIAMPAATRAILANGRKDDPFEETPDAMVARVLRSFVGTRTEQIVVLNDEAHHCYQDRPITDGTKLTKEQHDENATARRWFKGLQAVQKRLGIKQIYDLSATPYFLGGSGYTEGFLFPWVVSDFSLMDAIESGIVKIPRLPVDDDAAGELVTYLRLWDHIGDSLPKRMPPAPWVMPPELEGALTSLYRSYERSFTAWSATATADDPPPVFIVVCPNTVVSKLVYEWIAGPAAPLPLLSNTTDGVELARPRTILIDSKQLESGEAMKADFKTAAAAEIAKFQSELRRRRDPGVDPDKLTDEDLLREVMNTVGKRGRLGGEVRCVVSVAMLTEGWDANTVTHILGIRRFGSQLLCEQVVGRGLRRRSYDVDPATGRFAPEYANVYGIPFEFIPSDRVITEAPPPERAKLVASVAGREHLRIEFPHLDGYRVEAPDAPLIFDLDAAPRYRIGPSAVPTQVDVAGVVGAEERVTSDAPHARVQQLAFVLAKRLLDGYVARGDDQRPWDFPQLVDICRTWLRSCVDIDPGYSYGHILLASERQAEVAELIDRTITRTDGARERMRAMVRSGNPTGSTAGVSFLTRKQLEESEKSEISHVTLDGAGGNTWEQLLANACERDANVHAYAKNDHLGFEIPYVHKGRTHAYLPDFLVRLVERPDDVVRTLVVEVSGGQKSPGPTHEKAATARDRWCAAVNNHGGFGRWGYVEITSMVDVRGQLRDAIELLYADAPIVGDPDLLDLAERRAAS